MTEGARPVLLESLTVQVALVFAGIGIGAVLFDTAMGYALGFTVRYVPELFALLGGMFTALAAKNGADNFFSMKRETVAIQSGVVNPTPPPPPR